MKNVFYIVTEDKYTVSDVKLIPSSWSEKEYPKSPSDAPDKWKEKQIQSVSIGLPDSPFVNGTISGEDGSFI